MCVCVCVCVCVCARFEEEGRLLQLLSETHWKHDENELLSFWQLKVEHLACNTELPIYIIPKFVCPILSLSHIELLCIVRLFVNFHVCGYRFDATCWVLGAWRNYIVKMETFFLSYLVCLVSMKF
jgi:hypothetical protein